MTIMPRLTPDETAEVLTAMHLYVRQLAKAKDHEHTSNAVNAMRSIKGAIEETGQELVVVDGWLVVRWRPKKPKVKVSA